jgi:HTH-type transcriptional regulator/antitoxin HigA
MYATTNAAATDYAVPTGEYVTEWLEENNFSQAELARRMGVSGKHISKLIAGAPLTPDVALKLEFVTGVPARLWLGYEATYRADVVRIGLTAALSARRSLAEAFPLTHLRKVGVVTSTLRAPGQVIVELFSFFQVGSIEALQSSVERQAVAFRQGTAHPIDEYALATWLRLGEIEAAATREMLPEFSAAGLRDLIPELRNLSQMPPEDFGSALIERLSAVGVHLVYVPEVTGARVFGATRWIDGTPVIALTVRGRKDGQFWFTLFHELGHVLLHPDGKTHVRPVDVGVSGDDKAETEANDFSSEALIPPESVGALRLLRTKTQVREFATSIGVSPGIVVGRLWHEGLWDYTAGHDLCQSLRFKEG